MILRIRIKQKRAGSFFFKGADDLYLVSEGFLEKIQENTREYYWIGEIATKSGTVYFFIIVFVLNLMCNNNVPNALFFDRKLPKNGH